jgi:hypothetical protein
MRRRASMPRRALLGIRCHASTPRRALLRSRRRASMARRALLGSRRHAPPCIHAVACSSARADGREELEQCFVGGREELEVGGNLKRKRLGVGVWGAAGLLNSVLRDEVNQAQLQRSI